MNSPFVYLAIVSGQFDFSGTFYPVSYANVMEGNALPLSVTETRSILLIISGTTLLLLFMHYCVTDWHCGPWLRTIFLTA
jgi:hypothetical protein